jgi:hypothetical protein
MNSKSVPSMEINSEPGKCRRRNTSPIAKIVHAVMSSFFMFSGNKVLRLDELRISA